MDIDRIAADSLVAAEVAAVVNAKPSISGRYPNLGPEVLVNAGIPLVDNVGEEIFDEARDGMRLRIDDGVIYRDDVEITRGERFDTETVAKAMADARDGI